MQFTGVADGKVVNDVEMRRNENGKAILTKREEKLTVELLRLRQKVQTLEAEQQKQREQQAEKQQQARKQKQQDAAKHNSIDQLNRWSYVKLKGRFSREQWRMLRRMDMSIPTEHVVKHNLDEWNKKILSEIPVTKGETNGVKFVSISFRTYLQKVIEFHKSCGKLDKSTLKVKISGDGREIAKNLSNSVFCFSLSDLGDEANDLV